MGEPTKTAVMESPADVWFGQPNRVLTEVAPVVAASTAPSSPAGTQDWPGERPQQERSDLPDESVAPLLRNRLLFVAGLGVVGFPITVVPKLVFAPVGGMTAVDRIITISCSVAWLMVLPSFVLLYTRPLGVRQLRWLELAVIGGPVVQAVAQTFAPMPPEALLPELSTSWPSLFVIQWFLLITIYGVLIPNSLRRAVAAAGGMAALALITQLIAWAQYPLTTETWGVWGFDTLFYLGTAVGFAVFNSARLESYRREAAAARELGQYRLGRQLGGGGMGEVFAAEHRLLKRPCAVKLIRPDRAADDTFVRRFEREAAAAARLTHPAAVQVYDYGRADDGTFYYVMEYLPGLTLDEIVRAGGPMPPARAVHLLRQVCGALAEAHTLGLVHRDVKPNNIIVCDLSGRADAAKLLDFGLVVATDDADTRLTNAGGLLGTPAYMSPEQARGASDLTPASDLYSLGATAYFLLTGRPPFASANPLELLHAHQAEAVEPPSAHAPGLPPALEAVVLRLLAKRPEDRYPSAADVSEALAAAVAAPAA